MSKKLYDEASAIRAVSKKCVINYGIKQIEVPINSNNRPGNGTWGKIDYLCHYCGWTWIKTTELNKTNNADVVEKKQKENKRNNKAKKHDSI